MGISNEVQAKAALAISGMAGQIAHEQREIEQVIYLAAEKIRCKDDSYLFSGCNRKYNNLSAGYKSTENKQILIVKDNFKQINKNGLSLYINTISLSVAVTDVNNIAPCVLSHDALLQQIANSSSDIGLANDHSIHNFDVLNDLFLTLDTYSNTSVFKKLDAVIVITDRDCDLLFEYNNKPVITINSMISDNAYIELLNAPFSWKTHTLKYGFSVLNTLLSPTGSITPILMKLDSNRLIGTIKSGTSFLLNMDKKIYINPNLYPIIGDSIYQAIDYLSIFGTNESELENLLNNFYLSSVAKINEVESCWLDDFKM